MEKNIKNIRREFKEKGIFYTSGELARTLKKYVDFEPSAVYDPTCGQGNLLSVFPDDIPKYGQELDAAELDKARERLKNFHGVAGDTLTSDGFSDMKFDLIVANPPFSIKWTPDDSDPRFMLAGILPPAGKADYAFMLHILFHLSDRGKAVCLAFPGVLYRGNREGKIRRWMVEQNLIERVVNVPPKTFVDTAIGTCVIVFNKNKPDTNIIFEDLETGKEYTATLEEVKNQDFTLSTGRYIEVEEEREEIDPDEMNETINNNFFVSLRQRLEIAKMIGEIEGRDRVKPFLAGIKAFLAEAEAEIRPGSGEVAEDGENL